MGETNCTDTEIARKRIEIQLELLELELEQTIGDVSGLGLPDKELLELQEKAIEGFRQVLQDLRKKVDLPPL